MVGVEHAGDVGTDEWARLEAAALRAVHLYPGPVGELVARELRAHAGFGFRLGPAALVASVARGLLTPSE